MRRGLSCYHCSTYLQTSFNTLETVRGLLCGKLEDSFRLLGWYLATHDLAWWDRAHFQRNKCTSSNLKIHVTNEFEPSRYSHLNANDIRLFQADVIGLLKICLHTIFSGQLTNDER